MTTVDSLLRGEGKSRDVGLAIASYAAWTFASFLLLTLVLRPAVLFPPAAVDLASLPGVASTAGDLEKVCPVPDGLFAVRLPKDWIVRWHKSGNHLIATDRVVEEGSLVVGFDGGGRARFGDPRVVDLLRPRIEKANDRGRVELLRPVVSAGMRGFEYRARGDDLVVQQVELHQDGKRLVFTATSPPDRAEELGGLLHAVTTTLVRAKNF